MIGTMAGALKVPVLWLASARVATSGARQWALESVAWWALLMPMLPSRQRIEGSSMDMSHPQRCMSEAEWHSRQRRPCLDLDSRIKQQSKCQAGSFLVSLERQYHRNATLKRSPLVYILSLSAARAPGNQLGVTSTRRKLRG